MTNNNSPEAPESHIMSTHDIGLELAKKLSTAHDPAEQKNMINEVTETLVNQGVPAAVVPTHEAPAKGDLEAISQDFEEWGIIPSGLPDHVKKRVVERIVSLDIVLTELNRRINPGAELKKGQHYYRDIVRRAGHIRRAQS